MAKDFNAIFTKMVEEATVKCKIKPRSKHAIFVHELEKSDHAIIKKEEVKKNFYNFVNAVKKGFNLDEEDQEEKPKLEQLSKKLEDKYAALYRPNREIADATIERIFKLEEQDLRGRWIENRKKFKDLILSTSNSGAKDCFKLSLKQTKAIFGSSSQLRDRFQQIAKRCLEEGTFPKVWKEDTISFLSFRNDTRFKIGKILRSYLNRKSISVDRQTEDKYELKKAYDDQTAPQGSLLSPKLWRLFDGVFSRLYVDCLANLVAKTEYIEKIDHVAYADDHLTILLLKIYDTETEAETAGKIKRTLAMTRDLLFKATTLIGCSINPKKSENIIEESLHAGISEIETETEDKKKFKVKYRFKWLGYFLCLRKNHNLDFCEASAESKFKELMEEESLVYQYTDSIHFKWQMYKTYVCSYIELFLPMHIQFGFEKLSSIKKIQHRCLASVADLHCTTSRDKLEKILCEKSVEHKTFRLARRLAGEYRELYENICKDREERIKQAETIMAGRSRNRSGAIRNEDLLKESRRVANNIKNHYFSNQQTTYHQL